MGCHLLDDPDNTGDDEFRYVLHVFINHGLKNINLLTDSVNRLVQQLMKVQMKKRKMSRQRMTSTMRWKMTMCK